jgi:membrane protease YdiL (CAAX protease family)
MLSDKPWRAEIVIQFCAALVACFCLGILAAASLKKLGVAGFRHDDDFGNILFATLSFQGAVWILIPFFLRAHQIRLRDAFGFRNSNLFRALALAVAALIVVLPVALLLEDGSAMALEKIGWQPQAQDAVKAFSSAQLWPTGVYLAVFAVVIAPVAEEFIFRGVLFPLVRQLGFPKLAWFGVSFLFALIHLDAMIFIPLFALALTLTWLYEITDNLLAPIVAHGLFNAANLVILLHVLKNE